jgi:hypothetical protein
MKRILYIAFFLLPVALNAQIIKADAIQIIGDSIPTWSPCTWCTEWAWSRSTERLFYYVRPSGPWSEFTPGVDSLRFDSATSTLFLYQGSDSISVNIPPGGSTELADGITILGDGSAGDPFRADTNLLATLFYTDSLHAAQQAQLDTLPTLSYVDSLHADALDSLAVVATRLDTLLEGQGGIDTLPIWTAQRRLGNSSLSQQAGRLTLGGNRVLRLEGLTTAQLPSAAAGDFYYNTSLGRLNWVDAGSTRRGIAWQESTADFAEGRIPFAGSAGGLTSSGNFYRTSTGQNTMFNSAATTLSLDMESFASINHNSNINIFHNQAQKFAAINIASNLTGNGHIKGFISIRKSAAGRGIAVAHTSGNQSPNQLGGDGSNGALYSQTLSTKVGTDIYSMLEYRLSSNDDWSNEGFRSVINHRASNFLDTSSYASYGESRNFTGIATAGSGSTIHNTHLHFVASYLNTEGSVRYNNMYAYTANVLRNFSSPRSWAFFDRQESSPNAFWGATIIGDTLEPQRQLDVRGGLRVLPDSLQNTSTRLAGWNAAGDATGIVAGEGLTIAAGAGSAPDTLNVSFSAPDTRAITVYASTAQYDSVTNALQHIQLATLATSQGSWTRTDSTIALAPGKYRVSWSANFKPTPWA